MGLEGDSASEMSTVDQWVEGDSDSEMMVRSINGVRRGFRQ